MTARLARLGAAIALAVLACLLPTAPAGASPPPGGSFGGQLTGVSCVTASDCWAVGGTGNNVLVVDHWDGSAWSVAHLRAPRQSYSPDLPAISCASVASCWAVGDYDSATTSAELPFAEHWNGTAWSAVTLPHPAGAFVSDLVSVWCTSPGNCWAAGTAGSPAAPLLERWNGHVWALVRAPAIGARSTPEGVYCASASDCWITGYGGKNGTLAAHWDGSTWSVTPTPRSGGGELLGASCSGRDCVAVGKANRTLAEHWNGAAWTLAPTGHVNAFLVGVSCTAGFQCVATGNTIPGRVFSEVWNGSAWHIVTPKQPPRSAAAGLAGVSCVTATDCWSVGNTLHGPKGHSLIEHWNGTAWSIVS